MAGGAVVGAAQAVVTGELATVAAAGAGKFLGVVEGRSEADGSGGFASLPVRRAVGAAVGVWGV